MICPWCNKEVPDNSIHCLGMLGARGRGKRTERKTASSRQNIRKALAARAINIEVRKRLAVEARRNELIAMGVSPEVADKLVAKETS